MKKYLKNKPVIKHLLMLVAVAAGLITNVMNPGTAAAETANATMLSVYSPTSLVGQIIVNTAPTVSADQAKVDSDRAERLDDYFSARSMPLAGYGSKFVAAAKKCSIDWRLLPAISVRESSGGKHLLNNNPFGWGSAKIKFSDFYEAIDAVSDNLCGLNPSTSQYYADKTTYERLWAYNGTVLPSYPKEVMDIMDMI